MAALEVEVVDLRSVPSRDAELRSAVPGERRRIAANLIADLLRQIHGSVRTKGYTHWPVRTCAQCISAIVCIRRCYSATSSHHCQGPVRIPSIDSMGSAVMRPIRADVERAIRTHRNVCRSQIALVCEGG